MVVQIDLTQKTAVTGGKRENVLAVLQQMERWPYWNEVFLNTQKESLLSYKAFAQAVRTGDTSPRAFDDALRLSQMTQEDFEQRYLPEFQRFMALYTEFAPIGMLSDGVDIVWHAFQLISARYREFCQTFFGRPIDHFPCSLYPLYGVDLLSMSCLNKCVPSTCKGDGGGCGPDERSNNLEQTKQSILAATDGFVHAYIEVFGSSPDTVIWNQLANY